METVYYTLNPWWEGRSFDSGVERELWLDRLPVMLARKQVEVLTGSRRSGKTTILRQFVKSLLADNVPANDIFYLSLDYPSLSGAPVSGHLKNFRGLFKHERQRKLYLFLDEIQESPQWETELKSLYDIENMKIFCTGSSSTLITRQGGKLTGRQITSTVFPLSFGEFIRFRGESPSLSEDYRFERLADEYLLTGGYPEQVLGPSVEYMANLLDDILARDLARLYPIKKPFALKDLMRLVAASIGSRTSFNKLANVLGLSVDTVKEYVGYLEAAYLLVAMSKWTTSISERVYAQKKIYLWDTAIKTLFTGGGDDGSRAENAVFMELKRNNISCGYYAESECEVDFVVGSVADPLPIEVKLVSTFDLKDRRFSGVRLFLRRFPATRRVVVISKDVETELTIDKTVIQVIPLWKFLLRAGAYTAT